MTPGPTRYLELDGGHLAYRVLEGAPDGPDVLMVPGWFSHVEEAWSLPRYPDFLHALTRVGRVIVYDNRGMGMSDRGGPMPGPEERARDALALLEHLGSRSVAAVGISEGGTQALRMATLAPSLVRRVVALGAWARLAAAPDWPIGIPVEQLHTFLEHSHDAWGTGSDLRLFAPSVADDPGVRDAWARFERRAGSPGDVRRYGDGLIDVDIRAILPLVQCPVLLIHAEGDRIVPVAQGRYLASALPDARYVELPTADHLYFLDGQDTAVHEIERFLDGASGQVPLGTELGTVLFADVVGSTTRLRADGDGAWRRRLDALDAELGTEIAGHRGKVVKHTGDGLLATFRDPEAALHAASGMHGRAQLLDLGLRIGAHTGRYELRGSDVSGLAVHVAARVCAAAPPGTTVVSRTTRDLVLGSSLRFEDLGEHHLRGLDEPWRLYRLLQTVVPRTRMRRGEATSEPSP